MFPEVVIVSSEEGDWQGLYIDGELKYEGHSIPIFILLKELGIEENTREVGNDYLEEHEMPKTLEGFGDYYL